MRFAASLIIMACTWITGCSDRNKDSSQPPKPFPYTLQSWECGDWFSLKTPIDPYSFYCWPVGNQLFGSQCCDNCASVRIVEIRTNREKIILAEDYEKGSCKKHVWARGIPGEALATHSVKPGDAVVVCWENNFYFYWVHSIADTNGEISFNYALIPMDQLKQSARLFWKDISWKIHSTKEFIVCGNKLKIPFDVYYHLNRLALSIRYPLKYGERWNDEENNPYYITVVRKGDIDKDMIDLSQYRFKCWNDGMDDKMEQR